MPLTKSEYLPPSLTQILLAIKKLFSKAKTYGIVLFYSSVIMEFADGGDLYQTICQYKKKKKYFEEK